MGLLPTFAAHWRLNSMVRAWRKAEGILDRFASFAGRYATDAEEAQIASALGALRTTLDTIIKRYEDKVLSELKERI